MKHFISALLKNTLLAAMALLVSYGVFLFMYSFVILEELDVEALDTFSVSHITLPNEKRPEPKEDQPQDNIEEMPQTPSLNLTPVVMSIQMPAIAPPTVATNLAAMPFEFDQSASLKAFSATNAPFNQGGNRVSTGKKYVPYSSVQPNIPEIAWINRLNGSIEVSINIDQQGRVIQVGILDSAPKGIFEEEVIKAVYRWLYPPYIHQGKAQAVKPKQKIELFWRDYPNNVTL